MSARWVRMGDVFSLQRRLVELKPATEYVEIGLRSFGKGVFHKPARTGDEIGAKRVFHVEPGDLIISNVFGWEGAVALAGPSDSGTIGSHRFMTWIPSTDAALPAYVAQYLVSTDGLSRLQKASPGSAGRNRTLSISNLAELSIPLPSLAEQHRTAARLDAVARAVAYSSGAAALVTAKRAVWDGAAQSSEAPLGSVIDQVSRSRRVDHEATYRMLGVRWYGAGPFVRETVTGVDLKAKTIYDVAEGDLVYNRLFAWKGSFGLVGPDLAGATVSNEFPTFTSLESRVSVAYIHAWLQRPEVWSVVERQSTGSTPTSRNRFSIDNFLRLPLPLPGLPEQRRIVERLDAIDRVHNAVRRRDALAAALLPAARDEEFSRLVAQAG